MRVDKPVKVHWEGSKSVAWNAREKLPELARGFFETGRALAASHPSLQALHRFRLLTKRFRYTLELFRPCYGPVLDRRIEALKRYNSTWVRSATARQRASCSPAGTI